MKKLIRGSFSDAEANVEIPHTVVMYASRSANIEALKNHIRNSTEDFLINTGEEVTGENMLLLFSIDTIDYQPDVGDLDKKYNVMRRCDTLEEARSQASDHYIWTVVSTDTHNYILAGVHAVNWEMFLVTEEEHNNTEQDYIDL